MEGDGSSGQAEGAVFERLREFIDGHMSMSHVYQPLMLIE